ncbi:hypothetical protein [Spirosoma flavum]|uniref:Uncharacterized protein n=1 Tax=Spirosoma flavum TaxID=2048557 RepID=A0ABW6ALL8_9BACT
MALNFDEAFLDVNDAGDIPTSDNISGIELRLSQVFVKENGTIRFPPFPGFSKLYVTTIVISDLGNVIQTLDLKGFPKVGDNEELPVDRTIFFYQKTDSSPKPPSQIHVFISVIKSKQALRDVGKVMTSLKNDEEFAGIVSTIKSIAKDATAAGQISDLVLQVTSIIGKFLGNVQDKPLFSWFKSFTNLGGEFDNAGISIVPKENEKVKVVINNIVRDKEREEAFLAAENVFPEDFQVTENN